MNQTQYRNKVPSFQKYLETRGFVLKKQNKLGNVISFLSLDLVTRKELDRYEQTVLAVN